MQYAAVAALLDGEVTIDSFSDERRFSRDVEELLSRVRADFRADIPDDICETHTVVRVRMESGQVYESRCDTPRGYWGRPLTDAEMLGKFQDCAGRALSPPQVGRVLELANGLEGLDSIDEMMKLLREGDGRAVARDFVPADRSRGSAGPR